jgi:hypothetical protein
MLVIIIIVVTILIVLFLAAQFNLYSSGTFTFTYGDTVTIRSLATGGYLAPGCGFSVSNPFPSSDSLITADATAEVVGDRTQWIVVPAPPNASSQGYAFKNKATGQYLFNPALNMGADDSSLLLGAASQQLQPPYIKDIRPSSIDPMVLYEVSFNNNGVFLFRPQRTTFVSNSSGTLGVFTIANILSNGNVFLLATVGTINRRPPQNGAACASFPFPYTPDFCSSPNLGQCVQCNSANPVCVRIVPRSFYSNPNFSREQFLFKIERAPA